jgi:hypothetical protein
MSAFAQNTVIRYVWDKKKKDVLRKVEFVDIKKDSVFKTISVFDQNPYNYYNFPLVKDSSDNKVYDLNGVMMHQVFPDSLFQSRADWNKLRETGLVQGSSASAWYIDNPGFVILYYTFQTYVISGSKVGQTALFVFDKTGKLVKADYQPQLSIMQLIFSPSGRYLAYSTGKYIKDDIEMPGGSRMFDLQEPGFSWFEKEFNPGLYFMTDEKLMSVTDNQGNDQTRKYFYKVFDIGARKVYKRDFTPEEMSRIINLTPEAIIFKDNVRVKYTTDFKVSDLK